MSIKSSSLTVGLVFSLGTLVVATPAQAALIDFSTWNQFGDVDTPALGAADLSSNALQNDDSGIGSGSDTDFNFSGDAAIDSITLESDLGLPAESLDPDPDNFIVATEGSGLQQQLIFTETTTFSFDWTFLTNDETKDLSGFDGDDYAFLAIDGVVSTLASTNSSVSTLVPSGSNYLREVSGTFSQTFSPGTYDLALGVLDVDDIALTSALQISNADLASQPSQQVPEPSSGLGLLVTLGWFGFRFLRRGQTK